MDSKEASMMSPAAGPWQPFATFPAHNDTLEIFLLLCPTINRGSPGVECAICIVDEDAPTDAPLWKRLCYWTAGGPNGGSDFELLEEPTMWARLNLPTS